MTSDKIIKGLVKSLYNYWLGFLFLPPWGNAVLLLLLLLFWFDKDLKVLMPFGANTRTSCALFDALEVCGVSIDKQICTVFSYDAPLINLRTIRFFPLPCAESLFREWEARQS